LAAVLLLTLQVVTIGATAKAIAQSGTAPLPPLEVQAGKPKAKAPAEQQKAQTAPSVASTPPQPPQNSETGISPVRGFVAGVSATATKTDTPLLETPQAVSVVTRDQFEQQGAQSVKQALVYTSGVAADTRPAFGGFDIIFSRGFVLDRYLDGLKVLGGRDITTPQMELYGLQRLEVLHGPASMLYGASSLGGIVNAISKRPTEDPFREVEFKFGNFSHMEAAFDIGGPVTADKTWLYRLSGLARSLDSQVDFSEQERYWLAPAVTWRPTPGTTVTFLASFLHDPDVGLFNQVPAIGTILPGPGSSKIPRNRYLGEPEFNVNTRDQQSVGYALEHTVDDTWTIRQNLRYSHTEGEFKQILPLPAPLGGLFGTTLSRFGETQNSNINALTVDTNAQAKFSTGPLAHTLLFGVDYTHFRERNFVDLELASFIDIFNPVYGDTTLFPVPGFTTDIDQVLRQTGVYVQDQVKWDRLTLTLGAREDFSDLTTEDKLLPGSMSKQDDKAFTTRLGATYQLGGGFAPYVSYATSFQPNVGTTIPGGQPLVPTTGTQYEAGIKYQPPGIKALFTVAAYQLTEQNVLTSGPTVGLSQIGEVRSRGVEAEAKISLNDNLDLIAAYTHADTIVTQSETLGEIGKHPVNVPEDMASFWAFYRLHTGSLAGFGFGGGVRYVSETAGDNLNSFFVPSYTLFDAALQYDFGERWSRLAGLKLQLNVANVFDKEYVSECANDVTCVYGNGRTVITSLKYRW
jgi:iron complex outermembrane receptor protein